MTPRLDPSFHALARFYNLTAFARNVHRRRAHPRVPPVPRASRVSFPTPSSLSDDMSGANAFLSRVARLKLKEFPEFVFTTARDYDYRGRAATFAKEYNEKYISKGSIQPLFHFMGGVFGVAYVTVWPTEYRHMMAERRGGHH